MSILEIDENKAALRLGIVLVFALFLLLYAGFIILRSVALTVVQYI